MIQKIRLRLGLPLLTRRERRKLNAFWWASVSKSFPDLIRSDAPVEDKMSVSQIMEEFADAIEWLEKL